MFLISISVLFLSSCFMTGETVLFSVQTGNNYKVEVISTGSLNLYYIYLVVRNDEDDVILKKELPSHGEDYPEDHLKNIKSLRVVDNNVEVILSKNGIYVSSGKNNLIDEEIIIKDNLRISFVVE